MRKLLLLTISVIMMFTSSASAHSGRTDANGGHWNHSTGEYHYHNGGYTTEPTYEYYDDSDYEYYDYSSDSYYDDEEYVWYEGEYLPANLVVNASVDFDSDMVRCITVDSYNPDGHEIDIHDYIDINLNQANGESDEFYAIHIYDTDVVTDLGDGCAMLSGEPGAIEIDVEPSEYYEEYADRYEQSVSFRIPVEVEADISEYHNDDEDDYSVSDSKADDSDRDEESIFERIPLPVYAIVVLGIAVLLGWIYTKLFNI